MMAHGADQQHRAFAADGDTLSLTSISSSLFSSVKSHSTLIVSEGFVPRTKICLIGEETTPTLEAAAEFFELPVVRSRRGDEYIDDPSVVLVLNDFCDETFDKFANIKWRVVGAPALIDCANESLPLPIVRRPIFSFTMNGVITCFTGIRDRKLATELMFLIRSMGGSVRQEPNRETTHIIATTTKGPKYEYGVTFIVPIMSPEWVRASWKERAVHGVHATDDALMAYRQKPFLEVCASFIGFPKNELEEIQSLLEKNGGVAVTPCDPRCTHIVADDLSPVAIPSGASSAAAVVRAEWFWTCIQQVVRVAESEFPVPPENFRRPPQRGSVKRRVLTWINKENVPPSPSQDGCPAPPPSPADEVPPAGFPTRNAVSLSLASVSSWGNSAPTTPPSVLTWINKENILPPAGSPTPKAVLRLRSLSLASVSSWGSSTPTTPTSPCTPDNTLTPGTPGSSANKTLVLRADGCPPGTSSPPPASPSALGRGQARRTSSGSVGTPSSGTPGRRRAPALTLALAPDTPGGSSTAASSPATPNSAPGTPGTPRSGAQRKRVSLESVALQPISPRYGAFLELLHTEENYVAILDTILQMRAEALSPSQAGGVLLTHTEAKIIFGALMPIARTHRAILKDLRFIQNNWTETANVGEVFQKYSPDLLRDYAPFVSSFEDAKDMLQDASERNPRFLAFLKICRGKPQCGRQELHELMIRPIQRLGSCKLLLREILKHTPEDSPDRQQLESAVDGLSNVLSLINEDKRKMEALCKVFDIYNLVAKCPADLIASHRSLVVECEGVELSSQGFGKPGNTIAFFVFTDVILVCKKKSKVVAMMKGQPPGSKIPHRILKLVHGKPYKFLQILPLSTIRKIIDVADSENVTNAVGVVFRGKTEMRESCSYVRLQDGVEEAQGALEKAALIERWSCALANHNCVPDAERFVQRETAEEAGIQSTAEVLAKQLNKAAQMAARTQVAVKSALGLGRTQSASAACSKTSGPCAMSTFYSTSRLETLADAMMEADADTAEERPKPASLTSTIMKRM